MKLNLDLKGEKLIGIYCKSDKYNFKYGHVPNNAPVNTGGDFICFITENKAFLMMHQDDCCEEVFLEDIVGYPEFMCPSDILYAEMRTNSDEEPHENVDPDGSYLWTYYSVDTTKGGLSIRWFGSSNGYYSERVDLLCYDLINGEYE